MSDVHPQAVRDHANSKDGPDHSGANASGKTNLDKGDELSRVNFIVSAEVSCKARNLNANRRFCLTARKCYASLRNSCLRSSVVSRNRLYQYGLLKLIAKRSTIRGISIRDYFLLASRMIFRAHDQRLHDATRRTSNLASLSSTRNQMKTNSMDFLPKSRRSAATILDPIQTAFFMRTGRTENIAFSCDTFTIGLRKTACNCIYPAIDSWSSTSAFGLANDGR